MRLWLVHSGEVPLQDQIVAQISLGILSGELMPGERLPSIREVARRFHIHSNTVSLAYRRLERDQWLECRRGSGMYVQARAGSAVKESDIHSPVVVLDALFLQAARLAARAGIPVTELRARLDRASERRPPPSSLVLIEPEPEFQRIVLAELSAALPISAVPCTWPRAAADLPALPPDALALARPSKAVAVRAALPPETPLFTLRISSVPQWLTIWLPAPAEKLVGVASQWPPFLDFARTILVAAGFSADALLFRNPAKPGWQHGLAQTAAVVCDTHTATLLPRGVKAIPFPILADEGLAELRARLAGEAPNLAL